MLELIANSVRLLIYTTLFFVLFNTYIITDIGGFKSINTAPVMETQWQKVNIRHALNNKNYDVRKDKNVPVDKWFLVKFVNHYVNGFPYVSDTKNYGELDYWATPEEFYAKGGDCEDYAIAKYFILKDSGVPASDMKLMILYVKHMKGFHAVLDVKIDGNWYIMDIGYDTILPEGFNKDYQYIYSVNDNGVVEYK